MVPSHIYTLKFGLPPYFSPYFVPYTCKISTRRSGSSKFILSRDVVPFNRNNHTSKLHFDNSFAASGQLVKEQILAIFYGTVS